MAVLIGLQCPVCGSSIDTMTQLKLTTFELVWGIRCTGVKRSSIAPQTLAQITFPMGEFDPEKDDDRYKAVIYYIGIAIEQVTRHGEILRSRLQKEALDRIVEERLWESDDVVNEDS